MRRILCRLRSVARRQEQQDLLQAHGANGRASAAIFENLWPAVLAASFVSERSKYTGTLLTM